MLFAGLPASTDFNPEPDYHALDTGDNSLPIVRPDNSQHSQQIQLPTPPPPSTSDASAVTPYTTKRKRTIVRKFVLKHVRIARHQNIMVCVIVEMFWASVFFYGFAKIDL